MSDANDAAYYVRREAVERAIAAKALDPAIRDIHLKMAIRYAELAVPAVPLRELRSTYA